MSSDFKTCSGRVGIFPRNNSLAAGTLSLRCVAAHSLPGPCENSLPTVGCNPAAATLASQCFPPCSEPQPTPRKQKVAKQQSVIPLSKSPCGFGVVKSTSTLEESLSAKLSGRVHLHWKLDLEAAIDHHTVDAFRFHGVGPDVRVPWSLSGMEKQARGSGYVEAVNRGHFYCWAPKRGTLRTASNWKPFRDYRVSGRWLEDLWGDRKLTHETYMDLSLKVRRGHAARKRDFDTVVADERTRRVDERIASVNKQLEKIKAPFRSFPEVTAWEDSFLHLNFRWKLLVLCADSSSGKSNFAESLFENPYVLTVEEAEHLDLRAFEYEAHDGIVLDNVNSWGQVLKWRAVLQARNAKSTGGQSATNVFSYAQYLYGVPIVVTIDLDAADSHLSNPLHEQRSRWICKNCVVIRLPEGEAFYRTDLVPRERLPNSVSLFAKTVAKRRRLQQGVEDGTVVEQSVEPDSGPQLHWEDEGFEYVDAAMVGEEDLEELVEGEDVFNFGGPAFG